MEQMFYNIWHLHVHNPCNKTERWRAHNEQQKQRLGQPAKKFLA